jgi:hypothetical protein
MIRTYDIAAVPILLNPLKNNDEKKPSGMKVIMFAIRLINNR